MSLNTAHTNGGVLIHNGESILLYSDNVVMEFHGQQQEEFYGTKKGRIYLTTHRMIFNAKDAKDKMQSFSFPFITLSEVELEQPIFGANFIKGKVSAQPNGNWIGECKFKLKFKSGGAIEFGSAMLRTASMAQQNFSQYDAPPPYQPPSSGMYVAPPPMYEASQNGYYGWMPPTDAFPDRPPANTVYMTDMPPPYPGINAAYPGYSAGGPMPQQGAWGGSPHTAPQQNGAPGWSNPHYNNGQPMSQAGAYPPYGQPQQNYPPQFPPPSQQYPPPSQQYPHHPQQYPPPPQHYPQQYN